MAKINKKMLAKKISNSNNMTQKEALWMIDTVFNSITEELRDGNNVSIVSFGEFQCVTRKARVSINPKTGELFNMDERVVIKFKLGSYLKALHKK